MDFALMWFLLLALLYTGYFILEGFDFGVGILLPFLGKTDQQRRIIINTIGPHWDGNEVWLIAAGGSTFAAFPDWYATLFSGFYIPLLLILVALILRGVAFEFRSKDENPLWRKFWDIAIFVGSIFPAFLWGVAFTNLVKGVPIDQNMQYVGGFWNLLNPYAVLGGLLTLSIFTIHGDLFLSMKTDGILRDRSRSAEIKLWLPSLIILILFIGATFFATDILAKPGVFPEFIFAGSVVALLAAGWYIRKKESGSAFASTTVSIGLFMAGLFALLFPRLMISSLNPNYSLTIYNSASGLTSLATISLIALIFLPLVFVCQGWSYWIFRRRVTENAEKLEY